ncbi:MAG TPA: DUF5990 family protein [Terracidiphilus sp.]|jgi:hypothetical protein
MERELTFRIVLEKPPGGVDFALQKGKASSHKIVQKQRSGTKDLGFEFSARVAPAARAAEPNLLGPFVQGPPGARFVYVNIGTAAGQVDSCWSRRLKVPLTAITAEMVDRIEKDPKLILETHVPGTGKDGGPNCATVKPFAGWKLAPRK